jgi:hypothetical protein
MTTLSQERAKELFEYRDGNLYWLPFAISKNRKSSKAGRLVGTPSGHGYLKVKVKCRSYYVHQIVYLLHHGFIPKLIDHIDTDTSNNCIENLRETTKSQNACNSKIRVDNTSGVKGVTWSNAAQKWMARIYVNKQNIYCGLFNTIDEARVFMDQKRFEMHKEFANDGLRRAA